MCIIYMGLTPPPLLYCNTLGIQNGDRNFLGGLIPILIASYVNVTDTDIDINKSMY